MADPKNTNPPANPPADPPADPSSQQGSRDEAKAFLMETLDEWLEKNRPTSDDRDKPSTGADLFKKFLGF